MHKLENFVYEDVTYREGDVVKFPDGTVEIINDFTFIGKDYIY